MWSVEQKEEAEWFQKTLQKAVKDATTTVRCRRQETFTTYYKVEVSKKKIIRTLLEEVVKNKDLSAAFLIKICGTIEIVLRDLTAKVEE